MRKVFCLLASLALTLGTTGSVSAQQTAKFGALFPFSGPLALLGDESYRGVELAVDELNAGGGLNGQKIQLVKADATDPNQAVGEARRLTSVEQVKAVFGSYSSSISLAATQVTELAGVPYFELGAVSDPITDRGFKYLFRTNAIAKNFGEVMIDSVVDAIAPALKVDAKSLKVGIIHEDSLYGQTVSASQKERAKSRGLNVVETLPYSASTVDLSSVILRLKGAGADIILQTSYQNDTVLFFRQMKDQGFHPKAIIGAGGGYSMTDTLNAVGKDVIQGALDVDFPQYNTNPKAAPGIGEFVALYKARYGTEPRSGHSLTNYVGAKAILTALAKSKDLSADSIRDTVMKLDIAAGTTANGWGVKFDATGQNERAKPILMQWQDGQLVTVFPADAATAPLISRAATN